MIDDSFGNIGTLAQDVFGLYINLDKSVLKVTPKEYYTDLFNLMLWEDYGFFYEYYPIVFEKIPAEEIELAKNILLSEKVVLEKAGFDYQSKEAARFLSYF